MPLSLRKPSAEAYRAWLDHSIAGYAKQMLDSGMLDEATAMERSRRQHAQLLPEGPDTPGQVLRELVDSGGRGVGWLWIALESPGGQKGVGWVYNVEVDASERGKGYGRAAMLLAEHEARRHGLTGIALNVFGHNAVARRLYESLGYQTTALQMRKDLPGG